MPVLDLKTANRIAANQRLPEDVALDAAMRALGVDELVPLSDLEPDETEPMTAP